MSVSNAKLYDVSSVLRDIESAPPHMARRDIVRTIHQLQDAMGNDGVVNDSADMWPFIVEYFQERPRLTRFIGRAALVWVAFMFAAVVFRLFFS